MSKRVITSLFEVKLTFCSCRSFVGSRGQGDIVTEYMTAFSISSLPIALVEALVGGLIIACFVSYFLLRFFDKIPTKHPILKALILSFVVVVIIEVLSTFSNLSKCLSLPFGRHSSEHSKDSRSWNSYWLSIQINGPVSYTHLTLPTKRIV